MPASLFDGFRQCIASAVSIRSLLDPVIRADRTSDFPAASHLTTTDVRGPMKQTTTSDPSGGTTLPWPHHPALDGLRTVAVYLVVLFHCGVSGFDGGFLGVDLFFVLSGFLVSSILLDEAERTGRVRLGRFYGRRVRRLLPAAVVVVIATSGLSLLLSPLVARLPWIGDAQASLLYVSNWRFLEQSNDYFGADINRSPFLHFWSLSVEEQFYFALPLILLLLFKLRRRWRPALVTGVAVLAGLSVADQFYWAGRDATHAYYGTDARIYQLLVGVLAAIAWRRYQSQGVRARGSGWVFLAILLLTASSLAPFSVSWRGLLATGASVGLTLAVVARTDRPLVAALSRPTMTYLGQISYGTYLWHWPAVLAIGLLVDVPPWVLTVLVVAVATGLASASYELLEMPIRRSRRLAPFGLSTLVVGVACSVLVAATVVPLMLERNRLPTVRASGAVIAGTSANSDRLVPRDIDWQRYRDDRGAGTHLCTTKDETSCISHTGGSGLHVAVIGDSHARQLASAMIRLARRHDFTLSLDVAGNCPWQLGVIAPKNTEAGIATCSVHAQGPLQLGPCGHGGRRGRALPERARAARSDPVTGRVADRGARADRAPEEDRRPAPRAGHQGRHRRVVPPDLGQGARPLQPARVPVRRPARLGVPGPGADRAADLRRLLPRVGHGRPGCRHRGHQPRHVPGVAGLRRARRPDPGLARRRPLQRRRPDQASQGDLGPAPRIGLLRRGLLTSDLRPPKHRARTVPDPRRGDPGGADLVGRARRTGRGRARPGRRRARARARRRRRSGRGRSPTPSRTCTPRTRSSGRAPAPAGTALARPASPYAVRVTAVWIAASGSGEVTGQSLPITSRAPARWRSPNGYCQVARSSPRNGIVSSSICGSWAAQSACALAATPSSAKRGTSSGCTTWMCAMWWRRSRGPWPPSLAAAKASSASRVPRSPIACTCTWKPSAASATTTSLQLLGLDERVARVGRSRAPCPSRYGDEHRRREVLAHAVLHDLDARRAEPAARLRRAALDQVGDLLEPELAVPPERADHVGDQVAARDRVEVRRPGVVHAGVRADDRVLPGRDAEREQVALALEQPGGVLRRRRRRGRSRATQVHRALVQRALRACRPGSRSIRPSGGSGVSAVMPASSRARELTQAPWWSRLGRNTGRSGTTASRSAAVGVPPGNAAIAQPPPSDPRRRRAGRRTRGPSRGTPRACAPSVRSHRSRSRPPWIGWHVGVGEPGRDQPAGQVDDLGRAGRAVLDDRGRAEHRDDLPVVDEQVVAGQVAVAVEDRAAGEQRRPSASFQQRAGRVVGDARPCAAASPDSASRQTRLARYAVISAWS